MGVRWRLVGVEGAPMCICVFDHKRGKGDIILEQVSQKYVYIIVIRQSLTMNLY